MSFGQRISNVFNQWVMDTYTLVSLSSELKYLRADFPDLPETYDEYFMERAVLSLVNTNPVTHPGWPKYANTVEVGGFHVKPGDFENTVHSDLHAKLC